MNSSTKINELEPSRENKETNKQTIKYCRSKHL